MKKTIAFASVACVCAVAFNAFADDAMPPYYLDWFSAVGASGDAKTVSQSSDLSPSNGDWTLGSGEKNWDGTVGFSFDLDENAVVSFTAEQTAAPDTGTVTRVEITSFFAPVVCAAATELPSDEIMNTRAAQIGFAAVAVTNVDQTATFAYYAWTGNDGWKALAGAAPNEEDEVETTLVADFDYRGAQPTVTFSIGTESVTNVLEYNNSATIPITSSAASTQNKVVGVRCNGSGNIKSLTGSIAKAIAEMDGKKYVSLEEAVGAVSSATDKNITMLAETPENVTLMDGATITNASGYVTGTVTAGAGTTVTIALGADDIGEGRSGSYEVPVTTGAAEGGSVVVTIPYANKEIATNENGEAILTLGEKINVTIQTATSILAAVKPDTYNADKTIKATATNGGYTNNALRVFLAKYAPDAYTNANASAETIATALQASPDGSNGLALWQDYVLGIAPDSVIKPLAPVAGDGESGNIKLELPDLVDATYSGDYSVTYKVYKGETEVTGVEQTAGAIMIPASSEATGTYTVKAVLTP